MMGLCGYPGMLGWQSQLPLRTKETGQKIPGGVAIYCENAHVGVVFHDMADRVGYRDEKQRVSIKLLGHRKGDFRIRVSNGVKGLLRPIEIRARLSCLIF